MGADLVNPGYEFLYSRIAFSPITVSTTRYDIREHIAKSIIYAVKTIIDIASITATARGRGRDLLWLDPAIVAWELGKPLSLFPA